MPDFKEDLTVSQRDDDTVFRVHMEHANIHLGGHGHDGDLLIYRSTASVQEAQNASVWINGQGGNMMLGGGGADGDIVMFPSDATISQDSFDEATVWIDAGDGNLMLGGNGRDGDIFLFPAGATISQSNHAAATIHLNGDAGDIVLRNADVAEEFSVAGGATAAPGTVMRLDAAGDLVPTDSPMDRSVVGVVSGAGDYRPAIVMDRKPESTGRCAIALMGKVCVMVTGEGGPIRVGDLLTSSSTPGHAMRAASPADAAGAVIGKALAVHDGPGAGTVAIMIALQ